MKTRGTENSTQEKIVSNAYIISSTNKEYTCIIYITIIEGLKCVEFSVLSFRVLSFLVLSFLC